MGKRSRAEQETIIRWDAEPGGAVSLATFHAGTAARWQRAGYPVTQTPHGEWRATVPKRCISFRSYTPKPRKYTGFVSQSQSGAA